MTAHASLCNRCKTTAQMITATKKQTSLGLASLMLSTLFFCVLEDSFPPSHPQRLNDLQMRHNDCVQRALQGLCNAWPGKGIKGRRTPSAVLAAPNCSLQATSQPVSLSTSANLPLSAGLTTSAVLILAQERMLGCCCEACRASPRQLRPIKQGGHYGSYSSCLGHDAAGGGWALSALASAASCLMLC